jgi:hypothetical protein
VRDLECLTLRSVLEIFSGFYRFAISCVPLGGSAMA